MVRHGLQLKNRKRRRKGFGKKAPTVREKNGSKTEKTGGVGFLDGFFFLSLHKKLSNGNDREEG